jgi:hypothetical protein
MCLEEEMRKRALIALVAAGLLVSVVPAGSALASPGGSGGPLTVAIYGDAPYGVAAYPPGGQSGDTAELQKSPAFISTMNADQSVSEVIHVGDIHSGKDFCTAAYDNQIASLWQQYQKHAAARMAQADHRPRCPPQGHRHDLWPIRVAAHAAASAVTGRRDPSPDKRIPPAARPGVDVVSALSEAMNGSEAGRGHSSRLAGWDAS